MEEQMVISKSQFKIIQEILCLMYHDDSQFQEQIMDSKNLDIQRGT